MVVPPVVVGGGDVLEGLGVEEVVEAAATVVRSYAGVEGK